MDCSKERPRLPYATMSYCWGERPFFRLTSKTQRILQCGIPLTDFPPAFRDVMVTAQRLSIRYLWIDSYCIMQSEMKEDEVEDEAARREWIAEASKMKDVYSNGIVNFGAAHARDPSEGCFAVRDISHAQDFTIYWRPNLRHPEHLYHVYSYDLAKNEYGDFFDRHALMERGWVLQERILAPRTLYFGKSQIYWECPRLPHLLASETFPEGLPHVDHRNFVSLTRVDGRGNPILTHWGDVLQHYSRLALSHPMTDKLVALAGIAEEFAKLSNDEYVAGFFRKDLRSLLYWVSEKDSSRSKRWRAPTWSWASMNGPLKMADDNDVSSKAVSILDVTVEQSDQFLKYGPLSSGSITVEGPLAQVTFRRVGLEKKQSVYARKKKIDVTFDDVEEMQSARDVLTLLRVLGLHRQNGTRPSGLLLQREVDNSYRRLGVMKLKRGQYLEAEDKEVVTII